MLVDYKIVALEDTSKSFKKTTQNPYNIPFGMPINTRSCLLHIEIKVSRPDRRESTAPSITRILAARANRKSYNKETIIGLAQLKATTT